MKKLNSFLTLIDIYGTRFHLLTNQKLKFKTWIGGIITLILSLIGLSFIYIFGKDFFFRKNPSFTESTIGEGYKIIDLSKEKIIIAFRIEDMNGNYINTSKYLYPKIVYYSAIPGEDGKSRSNHKEEYIPYRLCEESDFEGSDNFVLLYGTLFCIEWKNKSFGGYWDNEFLYYFSLRIFYCNNSEYYTNDINNKCSSVEELNELFSDKVLFSVYYSTVQFRVDDLKSPLSRQHTNYFTFLSHNFRKNDKLFLNEQIVNDDQGWLVSSDKNISTWGGNEIKSDYEYYDNDKITTQGFSSMIYSFNIYMTSTKNYYTRKYMKVPDILSMIGGLITFINIFGKNIYIPINLTMKKLKIINQLFDFIEEENTRIESGTVINNNSILYKLNDTCSTDKNNLNNKSNTNHDLISNYNKKLYSFHHNLNKDNKQKKKNKNTNKLKFKNYSTDYINKKKNNNQSIKKKNSNKIKVPEKAVNIVIQRNLEKYLICCCVKNKKKDIYDYVNEIYNEKCEILNYFNIFKDIGFIKDIFFNPNQVLAINSIKSIKKISINFKNNFNLINNQNNNNNIIYYFTNRFKSKKNNKIDNYIFDKLEEDIKERIKKKL